MVFNFRCLSLLVMVGVSFLSYAQQNISTSSVTFIGTTHSVHAIIGDSFLGNSLLTDYSVEHTILSTTGEIVLGFTKENPISLKAFPNPFTSHLQIQFQSDSDYEIIVINTTGKQVRGVNTQTDINLKLEDIPKGIYIVKVVDRKKNEINVFEVIKL